MPTPGFNLKNGMYKYTYIYAREYVCVRDVSYYSWCVYGQCEKVWVNGAMNQRTDMIVSKKTAVDSCRMAGRFEKKESGDSAGLKNINE